MTHGPVEYQLTYRHLLDQRVDVTLWSGSLDQRMEFSMEPYETEM